MKNLPLLSCNLICKILSNVTKIINSEIIKSISFLYICKHEYQTKEIINMFSVGFNLAQASKYNTKHETAGSIAYTPKQNSSFGGVETAGSIASSTPAASSSTSSFCAVA